MGIVRGMAMGILDFFTKKADKASKSKGSQSKSAAKADYSEEELRKLLFDTIERNHFTEFEMLCVENEDAIMHYFGKWRKAPEAVQRDKDAMRRYSYDLMVIASYFQKQRNRSELMAQLTGIDDTEHSQRWQEQLGYCRALMQNELKFDEVIPMLEGCLDLAGAVSGAGVERFLPLTHGFLGESYFQKGEMDIAEKHVEQALQCTTMQGDYEASLAYLHNLYEINRYAGKREKAKEFAETIANKAYDRGELVTASNWRHHANAVLNEPLHRVIVKIGDELFELDEIPKIEGERVEFIFVRNRLELVWCSAKCYQGRELTTEGKYDEALKVFEEAATFDKYSPQPYYMSGNIKLASRNYGPAISDLEKVDELCPGFETSRADLWIARQLFEKKMDHDACMVIFETNNESIPIDERIEICRNMVKKYPNFGEAYWREGKLLADSMRMEEALAAFRKGAEVAEEADVRSRLLRDIASLCNDEDEKRKYFKEACDIEKGNMLAQAMSCYFLKQLEPDS